MALAAPVRDKKSPAPPAAAGLEEDAPEAEPKEEGETLGRTPIHADLPADDDRWGCSFLYMTALLSMRGAGAAPGTCVTSPLDSADTAQGCAVGALLAAAELEALGVVVAALALAEAEAEAEAEAKVGVDVLLEGGDRFLEASLGDGLALAEAEGLGDSVGAEPEAGAGATTCFGASFGACFGASVGAETNPTARREL